MLYPSSIVYLLNKDPIALKILKIVAESPKGISEICRELEISKSSCYYRIRKLVKYGLLLIEKTPRYSIVSINDYFKTLINKILAGFHNNGIDLSNNALYYTLYLAYGKFFSYASIIELMSDLTLEEKIEISHKIVDEALRVTKSLFGDSIVSVSFSGGKGSLVVLDIVLHHVCPDELYVIYCNTLNEYPENSEYVYNVVKKYFRIKKFVEIVPKFQPWKIWEIFGFPRETRDRYYTPACCILLKELPVKLVIEKYRINLDFTGIQASEAFHRLRSIADYGLIRRTKYIGRDVTLKKAIIRAMPIGIWLDKDIWNYIKLRNLPVNPIYEKYKINRQGCLACTNTRTWREHISKYNIELYKYIELKISEWGIQKNRIKYSDLVETLEKMFRNKIEALYVVKEHS